MQSVTHTEVTEASDGRRCDVRDVLDKLGDKWTVLVISQLMTGPHRFRNLQRRVEGISQRMLTVTLRRLERDGLVDRTVHPTVPPRVDYHLTPLGWSLTVPVRALSDWSQQHSDEVRAARQTYDATIAAGRPAADGSSVGA